MASISATRVKRGSARSFDTALLTVLVGKASEEKKFLLHEGIVCARSEFFRRAMSGDWVEKKERVVKLPEDDPEIFGLYVNLMYTNQLATIPEILQSEAGAVHCISSEHDALCYLYVLSEKLQDTPAKNEIVKAIAAVTEAGNGSLPPASAVQIIYEGTPKGSRARSLLADYWTSIPPEYLGEHEGLLPREFLVDLALALRKDRPKGRQSVAKHAGILGYLEEVKSGN